MAKLPLSWLPAPNSFLGFFLYSVFAYILVLLLGWCFKVKTYDIEDYRREYIEQRERREAKLK